jgi:hypothetical protein
MTNDTNILPYTIPDIMALTCIKRGMAIKIYLNEKIITPPPSRQTSPPPSPYGQNKNKNINTSDNFYTFQKLWNENNVTVYESVDENTGIKHVRKRHAPLKKGVQCVQYGPLSNDDPYNLLGKTITIDELRWFIYKSKTIEALPYIKQYEDNSTEAHQRRLKGVKTVIEKMWRQPAKPIH